MEINSNSGGTASARFLVVVIIGLMLTVIMLSMLADIVMQIGLMDKLTSFLNYGIVSLLPIVR